VFKDGTDDHDGRNCVEKAADDQKTERDEEARGNRTHAPGRDVGQQRSAQVLVCCATTKIASDALLANVSTWGMGPIAAGFFIAFCFLVVGCFLDAIPAIVIVGTVLEPLARSVDLHPVQFAIISIVSLAFGLVTPPYGLCLMIACSIAGVRLRYALKIPSSCWCPCLSCWRR